MLLPVVSFHVHLNLFILIAEGMKNYKNLFRLLKHNYKENYRTHSKHSLIRGLAYHLYISWFTDDYYFCNSWIQQKLGWRRNSVKAVFAASKKILCIVWKWPTSF